WGLNGAMWSTVLSEISVTAYQLFVVRKSLDIRKMFAGSWKYLLSGIVMFVPVFWLNTHMKASWLWMLVEVAAGIVIYVGMVLLLRAPVLDQLKELLAARRKKN
ncbi:polysaccharide biosynthesis C-terminal domain-containing protein, partial [Streptomyces scabiei]